jgi:hypothetical protein
MKHPPNPWQQAFAYLPKFSCQIFI